MMGIIQRQSIKYSIVNLIGALIGGVSMLFIYSRDKDLYGYAQMLVSLSYLLLPLATFGIGSVVIRFFREFKTNDNHNNGFLSMIFMIYIISILFFLGMYFLFKDSFYQLVDWSKMNSQILRNNEFIVLSLIVLLGFLGWLIPYISNFRRIVIPSLITDFGYKIFLPSIFLLCLGGVITRGEFAWLIPLFYAISVVVLLIYLAKLKGLKFSWNKQIIKSKYKSIKSYFVFSSLSSLGSQLTNRLDTVMIPLILGYASNGLYTIVYFMSNVIAIPTNSIYRISNPIISEAIERSNLKHIEEVYKTSSANLFLIGGYLYTCMVICLPDLFQLSSDPEGLVGGMIVFYFLGAGKLIDMLTSVNGAIINYSKYYKYNLFFILLLGLSNIFLNYYLINEYGIKGAAIATVLALVIFNLMKVVFIYLKFGIHPFSIATLKILFMLILIFPVVFYLQVDVHPLIDILINGGVVTILTIMVIKVFKVTKESDQLIGNILSKIK